MTGTTSRKDLHLGAQPNDGTGDPLRTAMDTINQNFIDIYEGTAINSVGQAVISQGVTFPALATALLDYELRSDLASNVSHLNANNTTYFGGLACTAYQTAAGLNANIATYINGATAGTLNINVYAASFHSDVYFDTDVHIAGNLHINGETTLINATIITTNDKNITLAYNATNAASSNGSGIIVGGNFANLIYNNEKGGWQSSVDIVPYVDATQKIGNANFRWDVYADSINATSLTTTSNVVIGSTLHNGDKYGNATTGSLGGAVINATFMAIGNSSVNSAITSKTITINSTSNGVSINSSSILLGNTSVNASLYSNGFSIYNATDNFTVNSTMGLTTTGNLNIVNKTLYVDSGTIVGFQDTTADSLGGVAINTISISIGNAVSYSNLNRYGLHVNTYGSATASSLGGLRANSSGIYVGNSVANSYMSQSQHYIGNSTTSTVITANSITVNSIVSNSVLFGSTTLNETLLNQLSSGIITVANSTVVSTGTGINTTGGGGIVNSTTIGIGNTSVNSIITSNTFITGNNTVNTYISSILITTGNSTINTTINSTAINATSHNVNTYGSSTAIKSDTFDASLLTRVTIATGTISFPTTNPFNVNDRVQYNNGGGTSINGLTSGSVYYVKTVVGNSITLSATPGGTTITFVAVGVGAGHFFTADQSGFKANTFGIYHGNSIVNSIFSQATITLNQGGTYNDSTAGAIGGLIANGTFFGVGNNANKTTITSTNIVTGYINAAAHTLGGSANLNTLGLTHTGYVNTTSDSQYSIVSSNSAGIQSWMNTSGVWTTGQINAASFTMGSGTIMKANTTALYYVNDGGLQLGTIGSGFNAASGSGGLKANSSFIGLGNTTVNVTSNTSTIIIGDYKGTATGSIGGVSINATAISIGNSITNFSMTSAGVVLPIASGSTLGGVKVGTGLAISGGILSTSGVPSYGVEFTGSSTTSFTPAASTQSVIFNYTGATTPIIYTPAASPVVGQTVWIINKTSTPSVINWGGSTTAGATGSLIGRTQAMPGAQPTLLSASTGAWTVIQYQSTGIWMAIGGSQL